MFMQKKWGSRRLKWVLATLVTGLLAVALGPFGLEAAAASSVSGQPIIVVSREAGSGTRQAFVELAKVVDAQGDDNITVEADVLNTTGGVLQVVAGNPAAIGYISFGSLNDSIQALSLDGVAVSAEAVRDGSYPLARPFNLAWKEEGLSELGQDFMSFVFSREGQAMVESAGYISPGSKATWQEQAAGAYDYSSGGHKGQLSLVGSTSLTPVIEKLAERYEKLNPGVKINVTSNGSTAGFTAALDGTADIGMLSRELTTSEASQVGHATFALDGIVVVVNPAQSQLKNLTLTELQAIFSGQKTHW